MTVSELLPSLDELSRTEKLRVVRYLVTELEKEESVFIEGVYPVWSPFDAHEAAATLMAELSADRAKVR